MGTPSICSYTDKNKIIGYIDVADLYLCLMESICRSDFCYLHQNRFPGHNLCYIVNSVFVAVEAILAAVAIDVVADLSLLDNHVVH
jgi:hypothetical protein